MGFGAVLAMVDRSQDMILHHRNKNGHKPNMVAIESCSLFNMVYMIAKS